MRKLLRVIIVGFILLCIFAMYNEISSYFFGQGSKSWPFTKGIITRTSIVEVPTADPVSGNETYSVNIRYEYKVDGVKYSNNTVSYSGSTSYYDRSSAETYLMGYPRKGKVRVYYNPDNPDQACLEPGDKSLIGTIGICIVMLILITICVYGIKIGYV